MDKKLVLELMNKLFEDKDLEEMAENTLIPMLTAARIRNILAGIEIITPMEMMMLSGAVIKVNMGSANLTNEASASMIGPSLSVSEKDSAILKQLAPYLKKAREDFERRNPKVFM